jgi:hypothetical protein
MGIDEMNLAEFSISFNPKDRSRADSVKKIIRVLDRINNFDTDRNGYRDGIVEIITKGELPRPFDEEVLLSILHLASFSGLHSPEVTFSRNELLKVLNIVNGGQSYERLADSIKRLSEVTLNTDAWYDVNLKKHIVVDSMKFYSDFKLGAVYRNTSKCSFIVLGEELFMSIKSGYVTPIELDVYLSFRLSLTGKLFRILNKIFTRLEKDMFSFGFNELVFDRLGFSPAMKIFNIRDRLHQSADELIEKKIILKMLILKAKGVCVVNFYKGLYFQKPLKNFINSTNRNHSFMSALNEIGILDAKLIDRIVQIWSKDEEKLIMHISFLKDYLVSGKAKGSGFAVMALLEKWSLKDLKDPVIIGATGSWKIRGYHDELIFKYLEDAKAFCRIYSIEEERIYGG